VAPQHEWCIPEVNGTYVARMEDVLDLYAGEADPRHPAVCFDESPTQCRRGRYGATGRAWVGSAPLSFLINDKKAGAAKVRIKVEAIAAASDIGAGRLRGQISLRRVLPDKGRGRTVGWGPG
jgi:hypothetical protein